MESNLILTQIPIPELVNLIACEIETRLLLRNGKPDTEKPKIRGIHGLAKYLGVSPVTAQSLKNSGKIPYSQFGRVILFDGDAVLLAMAAIVKPKKR